MDKQIRNFNLEQRILCKITKKKKIKKRNFNEKFGSDTQTYYRKVAGSDRVCIHVIAWIHETSYKKYVIKIGVIKEKRTKEKNIIWFWHYGL